MSFTVEKTPTKELWLKHRQNGIGGSDAAAILGHSPWKTPYELFMEKTGRREAPDISSSPKVRAGTLAEPLIRQMFAESHPELDVVAGNDLFGATPNEMVTLRSDEHPFMLADVDAVAVDQSGAAHIVEIKTAHMPSAAQWDDGVPAHYLDQVDHYLAVTGVGGAFVVVWIDGWDYREFYVAHDPSRLSALVKAETEFWERVETGCAPNPVSASDLAFAHPEAGKSMLEPTGADLVRATALLGTYTTAKATAEAAKASQDECARELEALIGDAKGLRTPLGDVTWIRRRSKKVDRDRMETEHPDVVGAYRALEEAYTKTVVANGGIRIRPPRE